MWQVCMTIDGITADATGPMSYAEALVQYEKIVNLHPEDRVVIRKVVE
jgi:hypothetical protein